MKRILLIALISIGIASSAQIPFSLSTNISGLHNFSPMQNFWTVGQNVRGSFHFSSKESAYASIEYYKEAKFHNDFTAVSHATSTSPQKINYTATGRLRYRQISLGWQHYFTGAFNNTTGINIYSITGFGFLFARATNSSSVSFDTTLYSSPVILGVGNIKSLTFDAGLGAEKLLGPNIYLFGDVRTWLPASANSSHYLHSDSKVPLTLMAGIGIRVLFGAY